MFESKKKDLSKHKLASEKNISGGTKVNESDGFCAALPYFLYNNNDKELQGQHGYQE